MQGMQLVLKLLVQILNRIGVRKQQLARRCEAYAVAAALKQPLSVARFQLTNVFGNGWLADKKLLGRFGKAQVARYRLKDAQTKIGHECKLQPADELSLLASKSIEKPPRYGLGGFFVYQNVLHEMSGDVG
jgi:hypothetical protein